MPEQAIVVDGLVKRYRGADRNAVDGISFTVGGGSFTLTVTDPGGLSASDSFALTVTLPPNTPPTISDLPDLTLPNGTWSDPVPFTVGDAETPASQLIVQVTTSNQTLVYPAGFVLGGTDADRTLRVMPNAGASGTAVSKTPFAPGLRMFRVRMSAPAWE